MRKMNMNLPVDYDGSAFPKTRVVNKDSQPRYTFARHMQNDAADDTSPSEDYVRDLTRVKLWALVLFTAAFFVYTFIHFDLSAKRESNCPSLEERAAAGIVVPLDITHRDC